MNFLAHSILSPEFPLIRLGNTFGDFVKGSKMIGIHPELKLGVQLHREIDHFTDNHFLVKEVGQIFKPVLARYSGIMSDMVFDYFLAKNWSDYSDQSLKSYVTELFFEYDLCKENLTERINTVAPIMKMHDWMLQYQSIGGLVNILKQMSNRINREVRLEDAIPVLLNNEQELQMKFSLFFNELLIEFPLNRSKSTF